MLRVKSVLVISIVLNLALIFSLIWGEQGIISYKRLYGKCQTLEEKITVLENQNVFLSKEIRLLQSDEKYIEKVIRNRLHFIRDNEIRYIFPEEQDVEPSGAQPDESKN